MKTKFFATKGNSIKGIDLSQYPDEAWEFMTGGPEAGDDKLYAQVAPVFRAVNLFANVGSGLPFALVNKAGKDVDISTDWQNVVGFLPKPFSLFRQWYMSLAMFNSCYGFMEGNNYKKKLVYIKPSTITPKIEGGTAAAGYTDSGLKGFTRTIGTQSTFYALDAKRIVYVWRRDHTTEIKPSTATMFRALASAAGIIYSADYYVGNYFSSGGVKPAIIGLKGVASKDATGEAETFWDKFIRNISRKKAKVVNADAITVTPFGDGIADMQGNDVFHEQCTKIAMAMGMSPSLLESDYANYATAQVYTTFWFRNDVFPFAQWFAGELTDQLFEPLGLKMEYRPEMTDEGTADEVNVSQAYSSYVSAGMLPSIAAQICGIEMPQGMEYAALDPKPAPPPPAPAETPAPAPVVPAPEPPPAPAKFVPSVEQYREMELWQTFAFKALKKSRSLVSLKFETKTLPADVADALRVRLGFANSEDEIKAAFGFDDLPAPSGDGGLIVLARALDNLAESYKATK
jgi:hypothetical protein